MTPAAFDPHLSTELHLQRQAEALARAEGMEPTPAKTDKRIQYALNAMRRTHTSMTLADAQALVELGQQWVDHLDPSYTK